MSASLPAANQVLAIELDRGPISPLPSKPAVQELDVTTAQWIETQYAEAAEQNQLALAGHISIVEAYLANARRLFQATHYYGISGKAFAEFAYRVCGLRRSTAYELLKLHQFEQEVRAWIESEIEKKGHTYRAPTWRVALNHVDPDIQAERATRQTISHQRTAVDERLSDEFNPRIIAMTGQIETLEKENARLRDLLAASKSRTVPTPAPVSVKPTAARIEPAAPDAKGRGRRAIYTPAEAAARKAQSKKDWKLRQRIAQAA